MSMSPDMVIARVQVARGKLYELANPTGFDYVKSGIMDYISTGSDSDNAKTMLHAVDTALAVMYRQLPAAMEGDERALRIFKTTVKNILPTISNFIAQPSALSRFANEVVVGTGAEAASPLKPLLWLGAAVGTAYVVRTIWMVK